ncbi:response regulator [Allorhizocola rhizosphaerae]|uniref:response regulator n=1 Tax=Allorhizocola rhizosphaerae TaxID=1872709 RepID=UPI001FE9227E|nr:response regulator [Allorhizocola rhizosphaerae]
MDDSPHFLEAARGLLQRQGVDVVGVAGTGAEAVALAERLRPDVALVDVGLDGESGFDVAGRLEGTSAILISTRDREDLADLVEASPAIGFLSKSDLTGAAIRGLLSAPQGTPARQGPAGGRRPPQPGRAS